MSDNDEWQTVTKTKKNTKQVAQSSHQYHAQRHQNQRHHRHHHHKRPHRHHETPSRHATDQNKPEEPQERAPREDNRKVIQECSGFHDVKMLRRITAHLETVANYSKGGIVGALRSRCIHNAEDREQVFSPIATAKVHDNELSFLEHLRDFCDNDIEGFSSEETDTLFGFLSILLASVAHMRFQNDDINNFDAFHDRYEANVWNQASIPAHLGDSLKRDLQQYFNEEKPVIDSEKMQALLVGDGFDFKYEGNLSVPFCLEKLHDHLNCNEAKTVRERRMLYRFEPKTPGRHIPNERSSWKVGPISRARDYKSQVEAYEAHHLDGEGISVNGINTLSSLLYTVYTAFLKIRKKQTPKDLLDRLKDLLLTLPNLIHLPELLQKVEGSNWCGEDDIEKYAELPDYKEIKKRLEKYIEKQGVNKVSTKKTDAIRDSLHALYAFNKAEEQKLDTYMKYLDSDESKDSDDPAPQKGYPLEHEYIVHYLQQLKKLDSSFEKNFRSEIKQLSSLPHLEEIATEL